MATLDHIRPIILKDQNPPLTNIHAIGYLRDGLSFLARTVRYNELVYSKKKPTNLKLPNQIDFSLVTCCHHWFSVSLVSYVKLVGLIDVMNINNWKSGDLIDKEIARKANTYSIQYMTEIIPEVYKWGNKYGAHFAANDPKNDSLSTIEYSLIAPASYSRPYLEVGGFQLITNNVKPDVERWSVIEVYERLIPRYWPNVKLDEVE